MPAPEPMAAMAAGTDPTVMMQQMMADAAASDPKMAMLAQWMASSRPAPRGDADDDVLEVARLNARLEQADARILAMKRDGRRLLDAYHACRDRLGLLAAALGACGLCWGEDDNCPSCRGRGRPGMVRPDPELRARLLGPPRRATPDPTPTDTHIC